MSKSHTPKPWRVSLDAYVVHVETDRTLAACPATLTIGEDEARANAELIVRAVNAHAALVSALEDTGTLLTLATDYLACETDMRELGGGPNGEPGFTFADLQRFVADARAALKLAKGE